MPDCARQGASFIPVAVETLRNSSELNFDLYLASENRTMRLYRSRDVAMRGSDIDHLLERGIRTLYTPQAMSSAYGRHLRERVLSDPTLSVADRYTALTAAARTTFTEALRSQNVGQLSGVAADMSVQLVELLSQPNVLVFDLIGVMVHDYSTFEHAAHVSTYSVLLAKELGIASPQELNDIARGGLLHDIGKIFVSDAILQKPGRLSDRERRTLREHPQRGFTELAPREDIAWGTLMMVYQHHERCDGSGYPVGHVGEEIHPWGRICAIADVFDALLRDRSYRKGNTLEYVADYLMRHAGTGFDKEMTACWIKTLQVNN